MEHVAEGDLDVVSTPPTSGFSPGKNDAHEARIPHHALRRLAHPIEDFPACAVDELNNPEANFVERLTKSLPIDGVLWRCALLREKLHGYDDAYSGAGSLDRVIARNEAVVTALSPALKVRKHRLLTPLMCTVSSGLAEVVQGLGVSA